MPTSRPRRLRRLLGPVLLSAALAAPALLPAGARGQVDDSFAQRRRIREQQYKSAQNTAAAMAGLKAANMDEVIRLRLENGHLACSSPLLEKQDLQDKQFHLDLPRLKGPTYIQTAMTFNGMVIRPGRGPVPNTTPQRMVTLINYQLPSPDELTTLSIQAYPNYLHLTRSSQTNVGTNMVRLMDQRDADGKDGVVQVFVNEFRQDGQPGRNVNFEADDFQSLLRQHPKECEELIRPLLRTLGQEAVFAPEPEVAWQVLSDWWKPRDDVARKVSELLPAMRNANYHAREQAVAALEATGRAGATVLRKLDRSNLTPEQNLLIDRALAPYNQLPPKDVDRLRSDKGFLIDCLYGTDAEVRSAALDRLNRLLPKPITFNNDAPAEQRVSAVDALRHELLPEAAGPTTAPAK